MTLPRPRLAQTAGLAVVARLCVVGVLGMAAAGCGPGDGPIRIGIAGPFSEARGRSMLLAAQLAVREINEAGGVNGRQLELVAADDSANPARAIAVAQQLRDDPTVVAVVGHLTSGATIAAADIYQAGRNPVVSISPSASNPDLSGFGPWFFRVCATDLAHGAALARFAFERLNAASAAVLYLNDDYGRGILRTFADEFRLREGAITTMDPMLPGVGALAPYLERLRRDGRARVIMVAGDRAAGAAVLRQARERGIALPLIGGDGLSGIEDEGAIAEGVYITSNYLPDQPGPRNAGFLEAYAAATGGSRPDHRGAGSYDAVYLVARSMREAGTDRRSVRDALARINGRDSPAFDGVTGRIAFDERGDVVDKNVVVGVVRGGRIVPADAR